MFGLFDARPTLSTEEVYLELFNYYHYVEEVREDKYNKATRKKFEKIIPNIKEPTWELARSILAGEWKITVTVEGIQREFRHKSGLKLKIVFTYSDSYDVDGLYECSAYEERFIGFLLHDLYQKRTKEWLRFQRELWAKALKNNEAKK